MNKVTCFVALCALLAVVSYAPRVEGAVMNGTHLNPPFGVLLGLSGVGSAAHNPFINWMKLALPWGTGWGNFQDLLDDDHIDIHGQVFSVPAGGEIRTWVLFMLPATTGATGRFRLSWAGNGTVEVEGGISNVVTQGSNRIFFDYVADGTNQVVIKVKNVFSGPLRNFVLVHQNDWPIAAQVFRPSWVETIRNNRILKFKDWQNVDNYEGANEWNGRTRVSSMTYQMPSGYPPELMIDLCNLVGADCYFNMPHSVSTAYMRSFANLAVNRLHADRHVYVEYTNKVWDYALGNAIYTAQQAALLFNDTSFAAALSFYGGRSAEMAMAWQAFWTGANRARLHTVLQAWTDNHWAQEAMLNAPQWVNAGPNRIAPKHYMTHLGVHAILDGGLAYPEDDRLAIIQGWINTMTPNQLFAQMALTCRSATQTIGGGRTLEEEIVHWQFFKQIATDNNMTLIVYEGGSHIVTPAQRQNVPLWTNLYNQFHMSSHWSTLYNDLINAWYTVAGPESPFLHRSDMALPSMYNNLGLRRYIGDSNLQLTVWNTQQAARHGVSRGPNAFVGTYEIV